VARRWIVVLALVVLGTEVHLAFGEDGGGTPYRAEIVVPGDPALADEMKQVSQLIAREGKVESELALQRRAAADLDRLNAAARAAGYYDAKLAYDIDTRQQPWRATVKVDLGQPYRLREVRIVTPQGGPPPLAERFDLKALGLELGMRVQSAPILAAEGKLQRFYTTRGWPLAKVTGHQAVIDRADRSMHITYTVVTGPTARFGKVEITGLESINRDYVERKIAWKEGQRYDSSKVDATQQALIGSNLFSTVRVAPADKVGPDGRIAMSIALTERPQRTIGGGLYYDSSLGFGAKAFWEHRNLFGEGELLHLEANAGQSDNSLLAQFKRPDFLMQGLGLRSEASIGKLNTDAYDTRQAKLFTGVDYQFDPLITGGIGAEVLNGRVDDDTGTQNYTLAGLPAYIRRDDTDDLLNPSRGTRLGLTATPFFGLDGNSPDFFEAKLSARGYQRIGSGDRFILAAFTNIGSISGTNLDSLPRDLRLYEGGGGSVRGYGFQRAGPLDIFGNPLGGISSLDLGLELRTKINDTFGFVTFFEGGSVYGTVLPDLSQRLYWGTGVGLRYYSPLGPLRFDIATPLDRRPSDGIIQIYISLGQAF
jgi:translocation and assembly module TamA